MQTTFKLFIPCLVCLALLLLSGCAKSLPKLTTAEQAEVDTYIKSYGRHAIAFYLANVGHHAPNTDEEFVLKYVKWFVSQGADVNAKAIYYRYSGQTPLDIATSCGHATVVRYLKSVGAKTREEL